MRTMKFLSLITVLIVLVTLFTLVISQMNKDETKHEYGIAFPLEESETTQQRLQQQLASLPDLLNGNVVGLSAKNNDQSLSSSSATTTTETVATYTSSLNNNNNQSKRFNDDGQSSSSSTTTTSTTAMKNLNDDNKINESNGKDKDDNDNDNDDQLSPSIIVLNNNNNNNKEDSIDSDQSDSVDQDRSTIGNINPKLIFIERLMDLNFQQPPPPPPSRSPSSSSSAGGLSSFFDIRDPSTLDSDSNKTADDSDHDLDSPWSNTFDNIRSKWENRLRKFTYPLQNTYSVVLRASNVVDNVGPSTTIDIPSENGSDNLLITNEKPSKIDQQTSTDDDGPTPGVKFFYHQSSIGGSPLNGFTSSSSPSMNNGNDPSSSQANQLIRMAALTMMSKLFSALRSQAMTPSPKMIMMGTIPKMATGSADMDNSNNHHEIDLDGDDDDDDDMDGDDRTTETISVPILLGQKSRSSNSIQDDSDSDQTIRTTIMYGRSSPPSALSMSTSLPPPPLMMMGPRYYPSSSSQQQQQQSSTASMPNPLAAIIQAIAAQTRSNQPSYRRQIIEPQPMMPAATAEQPQRLILLITHRSMPNEASREESPSPSIMFPQSPSSSSVNQPPQQNFAYYQPLSPPSSPILYQYSPSQPQLPPPSPMQQTRPHVVEVPVPVYVPVRVRAPTIRSPSMMAPIKPAIIHRSPSSQSPMAIVYYNGNNNEQMKMAGNNGEQSSNGRGMAMIMTNAVNENAYSQQQQQPLFHVSSSEPSIDVVDQQQPSSPGTVAVNHAVVRILLRPKGPTSLLSSSVPVPSQQQQQQPLLITNNQRRFEQPQDFQSEEDQSHPIISHISMPMVQYADSRLQQWRDYQQQYQQQQQQQQPQPHPQSSMTHIILAAATRPSSLMVDGQSNSDDNDIGMMEPSSEPIPHHQQQQQHFFTSGPSPASSSSSGPSPYFYSEQIESQQPTHMESTLQHHHHLHATNVMPQMMTTTTSSGGNTGGHGHAAFLILADPNETMIQSQDV